MRRRDFLTTTSLAALHGLKPASLAAVDPDCRQATGIKIGEVTPESAIAWLRLTERSSRQADGELRRARVNKADVEKVIRDSQRSTREFEGSTPGAPGRMRLAYATNERLNGARRTDWVNADPASNYASQFALGALKPDTIYHYAAETASPQGKLHAPLRGQFRTAPRIDSTGGVRFCMTTCQKYSELDHSDGFHIYESIRKLDPRFFISAGDIVYYDSDDPQANTVELARYHWDRMFSFPRHIELMRHVPGYWEKDDHDTLTDDVWPDMKMGPQYRMSFADGLRIFRQQVPMGPKTYRTFRWGKTLQVWLVEGRDYRSPNRMPDGPEKSIWGVEQKQWLMRSMAASDADWRILISPTPVVGPDRPTKGDNHSNAQFAHEGKEFREWAKQTLGNNFVNINGDRHWQYHSVHPQTGTHEFSVGPSSDSLASGTPGEDKNYHRFHRVKGGFLEVETERRANESFLHFRLRDVMGAVTYSHSFSRLVKA
ncbi:MAG: alkaline phosphatase D family protein [Bryobacterales bacterium]|nr:alkaline phosphatase D family protein [Bryobacterales bacterium]